MDHLDKDQPDGRQASRDPADTADRVQRAPVAATAPTKGKAYCSKLVRSIQETPTETAKAAPPNRWRHDQDGNQDG